MKFRKFAKKNSQNFSKGSEYGILQEKWRLMMEKMVLDFASFLLGVPVESWRELPQKRSARFWESGEAIVYASNGCVEVRATHDPAMDPVFFGKIVEFHSPAC